MHSLPVCSVRLCQIRARVAAVNGSDVASEAITWRRHLHAHPELAFHEHETARFVRETLVSLGGLEIERPTPTSVVARPRSGQAGPTLALRADIDALPIEEDSGVDFASRTPGVMHACGHDGHTAMLLAVARLLVARRDELTARCGSSSSTPRSSLPEVRRSS
jgi:amidohydrolase